MTRVENRTYRAREFARLAGVTVRALHHYDRLGLLKPQRTQAGYRVYSEEDLKALEQIVALKFIGLPLKKIKVPGKAGASENVVPRSQSRASQAVGRSLRRDPGSPRRRPGEFQGSRVGEPMGENS